MSNLAEIGQNRGRLIGKLRNIEKEPKKERIRRESKEREENRKKNDRYWYERIHDL